MRMKRRMCRTRITRTNAITQSVPIPGDLDLHSVSSEKLDVWIGMLQERHDQPPRLVSFLNVKELLLQLALLFGRKLDLWRKGLLY